VGQQQALLIPSGHPAASCLLTLCHL